MKKIKYWFLLLASLLQFMVYPIAAAAQSEVIDYTNNNEILGLASAFGMFAYGDVGFNGSDLESRLACGGSANIGSMEYYSTARCVGASVICQGDELKSFDTGDRLFAIGSNTKILVDTKNYLRGNWINFDKEFEYLQNISYKFSRENNGSVEVNKNWNRQIDFKGNSQVNYFEISSDFINSDKFFFNFEVPEDSYSIVNIKGGTIYTQLYGCTYASRHVVSNSDPITKHILFNYIGGDLEIKGSGTLYGTILAPRAYVHDSIISGSHCTGSIICNSFLGGIEIGGNGFNEPDEEFNGDDSLDSIPGPNISTIDSSNTDDSSTNESDGESNYDSSSWVEEDESDSDDISSSRLD